MTPSLSLSTTNMSTFKTNNINNNNNNNNPLPSKPSEVKRRSNNRKQIYATITSNNKTNENETSSAPPPPPPPPPPPFPINFNSINKVEQPIPSVQSKPIKVESITTTTTTNDFQVQIEQAKNRLKKIDKETSSKSIFNI
ncbi:unnamed protein product, partial [Adineta steineri]